MTTAFDVDRVSRRFPGREAPANDDISLSIAEGSFFGLLGSNGAGKTTLVKHLIGLLAPDSGEVRLHGRPVLADPRRTAMTIGYMPQSAFAVSSLTVREAVYFTGRLRGLPSARARVARDALLEELELGRFGRKVVRQLSGGERRLLQLGVTLVADPPVLVLDEPTNELDPARRRQVWDLLAERHRSGGHTVVLITHNAVEAEQVLEQVGILRDGRLVALGTPAELKAGLSRTVRVSLTAAADGLDLPGYVRVERAHGRRVVGHLDAADVGRLARDVDLSRLPELTLSTVTLDDVYLRHAG